MCDPQAARARRDTSSCHGSCRGRNHGTLAGLSRVNRNERQNRFRNGRKGTALAPALTSAFGGIIDMAAPAAGSTRSRMAPADIGPQMKEGPGFVQAPLSEI